jgi:D-glucosaminate-6-phosphate ammonia-lyase
MKFAIRKIINAAGPVSVFGGGAPNEAARAAALAILPQPVEIAQLQALASERIAAAFGCDAGCVTAGSAAGIAIAVAAAMTGTDLRNIAQLPDAGGMKHRVVMQRGHDANFGTLVSQMIRLAGATADMIGTTQRCDADELRRALGPHTAAAIFVVSHHTAQSGMIGLRDFCAICHAAGVPVIVDAAGEHDLGEPLRDGADLAIASAHKNYSALTAGIVAGRRALIEICLLQDCGIGRPMKVGKESIASVIAALDVWTAQDRAAVHAEWTRRARMACDLLAGLPGFQAGIAPDMPGSPLNRARIHAPDATAVADRLAAADPSIRVWRLGLPHGYFELDPRTVTDEEMREICRAIRAIAT